MNKYDACKILNLSGDITPEIVKKAYRKACSLYHPDRNPAGLEMMKAVNQAYDVLRDLTDTVTFDEPNQSFGADLNDALNAIVGLPGIEIEVCGTWVWVSGDTRQHKEILKASGYLWASKKLMWYYRPEEYKRKRGGNVFSIDEIRSSYGSSKVGGVERRVISN
jgi:curved DNA-binding protein CbpA